MKSIPIAVYIYFLRFQQLAGVIKGTRMERRKKVSHEKCELYIEQDEEKGRCVFTKNLIQMGNYFLKYNGTLCKTDLVGDDTYVCEFRFHGKKCWIDSTKEDVSFGRLVNDEQYNPNSKVEVLDKEGIPELYFVSLRTIDRYNEILYNYGAGHYPWRKNVLFLKCHHVSCIHAICPSKITFKF